MEFIEQSIKGVFLIKGNLFNDDRGSFLKVFNNDIFVEKGLNTNFKESYFSVSKKGVVRGMHFQNPPDDHEKLVYVSKGNIIDVLLDIRKYSPTFGEYITLDLNLENGNFVYIPKGIAHGFLSLEDDTIVNYLQTSCYSKNSDNGILYNSFGYKWEELDNPIISQRDFSFSSLEKFDSPFYYEY